MSQIDPGVKERRRMYFNEQAEQWLDMWYRDEHTGEHTKHERDFERLSALVPVKEGDHVLDVGCGTGVLVPYLLERVGRTGRVYELDYAEKMIEVNRRLHKDERVTFIVEDILDLSLGKERCDLVMCFGCFPHLDDKTEAMRVMSGALRDGGCLAIAHFLSSHELNDHHSKAAAVAYDKLPDEPEMSRLFAEADLALESHADHPGFYLMLGKKLQTTLC